MDLKKLLSKVGRETRKSLHGTYSENLAVSLHPGKGYEAVVPRQGKGSQITRQKNVGR